MGRSQRLTTNAFHASVVLYFYIYGLFLVGVGRCACLAYILKAGGPLLRERLLGLGCVTERRFRDSWSCGRVECENTGLAHVSWM